MFLSLTTNKNIQDTLHQNITIVYDINGTESNIVTLLAGIAVRRAAAAVLPNQTYIIHTFHALKPRSYAELYNFIE